MKYQNCSLRSYYEEEENFKNRKIESHRFYTEIHICHNKNKSIICKVNMLWVILFMQQVAKNKHLLARNVKLSSRVS